MRRLVALLAVLTLAGGAVAAVLAMRSDDKNPGERRADRIVNRLLGSRSEPVDHVDCREQQNPKYLCKVWFRSGECHPAGYMVHGIEGRRGLSYSPNLLCSDKKSVIHTIWSPLGALPRRTLGELLLDVEANNVERVVITRDNNVKVTRRNGERYELGRFKRRDDLLELVPPEGLRDEGVIVEVKGRAVGPEVFEGR